MGETNNKRIEDIFYANINGKIIEAKSPKELTEKILKYENEVIKENGQSYLKS